MSNSTSTLLLRNLRDVLGENNLAHRRAAIDHPHARYRVFYDSNKGIYLGRDEIDRIVGAVKATHPDFQYQPIGEPEESGNAGRSNQYRAAPGKEPAYAGLVSSFLVTAGLPPFTSFSTSYPEQTLPCDALSMEL